MPLLLDEHLAPGLVQALAQLEIEARSLREWRDGVFLGTPDDRILRAAADDGLIFVTVDGSTVQPMLQRWAQFGQRHHGVMFVQSRDAHRSRIGATARKLARLLVEREGVDWTDRVVYLPPD